MANITEHQMEKNMDSDRETGCIWEPIAIILNSYQYRGEVRLWHTIPFFA